MNKYIIVKNIEITFEFRPNNIIRIQIGKSHTLKYKVICNGRFDLMQFPQNKQIIFIITLIVNLIIIIRVIFYFIYEFI